MRRLILSRRFDQINLPHIKKEKPEEIKRAVSVEVL